MHQAFRLFNKDKRRISICCNIPLTLVEAEGLDVALAGTSSSCWALHQHQTFHRIHHYPQSHHIQSPKILLQQWVFLLLQHWLSIALLDQEHTMFEHSPLMSMLQRPSHWVLLQQNPVEGIINHIHFLILPFLHQMKYLQGR